MRLIDIAEALCANVVSVRDRGDALIVMIGGSMGSGAMLDLHRSDCCIPLRSKVILRVGHLKIAVWGREEPAPDGSGRDDDIPY